MYFRTLAKEASIVQEKHGFRKAWLSAAAIYDIVPGLIMAFYFAQLSALGAPLRAMWGSGTSGEDYAREFTGDRAPIEQLLLRCTGPRPPDWVALGVRITDVQPLLPELYTVCVPAFKPLTAAMVRLSKFNDVEVLRISHQAQVQVRVAMRQPEPQLAALRAKGGVQVLFDYAFPADGSDQAPPRLAALCVDVPFLLGVIRFCRQHEVEVLQVYDFWG